MFPPFFSFLPFFGFLPFAIALTLTVPEAVTPHNIGRLAALVANGPHPPPGQTGAK